MSILLQLKIIKQEARDDILMSHKVDFRANTLPGLKRLFYNNKVVNSSGGKNAPCT